MQMVLIKHRKELNISKNLDKLDACCRNSTYNQMDKKEFSGGAAKVYQVFAIFIVTPFLLLVAYFLLRNEIDLFVVCLLAVITIADFFVLKYSMSSADIYLSEDNLIIEKLFGKTTKSLSDVELVDDTLNPTQYYIQFKDDSKVFFTLKTSGLIKRVYSDRTAILNELRTQLRLKPLEKDDDI